MVKLIEVKSGDSDGGPFDYIQEFDTIKAAKAKAAYLVTDAYAKYVEASAPNKFAGVYVNGILEHDYYAH